MSTEQANPDLKALVSQTFEVDHMSSMSRLYTVLVVG